MSRLRALLSAGRLARGAGETAPAGASDRSGGMGRRRLLGLMAAAPVALPAAVRAATALERIPALGIGTEFMGVDCSSSPLVTGDWSRCPYAEFAEKLLEAQRAAELSLLADAARPEIITRAIERQRADMIARGLWAPALVDTVGSGP